MNGSRASRLETPGKVNFGLRICGRRSDGYHLLESLFLPVDLVDEVRVALTGSDIELRLATREPSVPEGERNLAWRAARAFLDATGLRIGVRIALRKRIPTGAGLGGGSSDAAAVLRLMSDLLPGALPPAPLREVALSLGADVPFFLDPRPARVSGIGEVLEPLRWAPALPLLLLRPPASLATAEVYAEYDALAGSLTPAGAVPTLAVLEARLGGARAEDDRRTAFFRWLEAGARAHALLANDLEPAAVRLCPAIAALRREIERVGAIAVGLSGSGPTLFGVFTTREAARAARKRLRVPETTDCQVATTWPSG